MCEMCNLTFETRADLDAHDGLFHTHPHHCDLCHKGFNIRAQMVYHRQSHFNMRLKCPYCPRLLKTERTLETHVELHTNTMEGLKYPCKICSKVFTTKMSLFRHRKNYHLNIKCEFCPEILDNQKEHLHHVEINHQSSSVLTKYKCSVCKKCFSQRSILFAHKRQLHKFPKIAIRVRNPKYGCYFCSKIFTFKPSLEIHVVQHLLGIVDVLNVNESMSKLNLSCTLCYKGYLSKEEFKQHNEQVHPDIILCEICTKQFFKQEGFLRHKRLVHFSTRIECKICQQTFKTDYELGIHLANSNHAPKSFDFKFCPEKLDSNNELDAHKKSFHKNKLKFECSHCEERFETKKSIASHILRIHKKTHSCHHCKKLFGSKSSLNEHLNSCKKDKTHIFKCTICFRDYTTRQDLKMHYINAHLNPFSFKCKICSKRFNKMHQVKLHMKAHHAQQI
jgi:KRAB domain-containing zinc finger protein